jgi:hypothetical protein
VPLAFERVLCVSANRRNRLVGVRFAGEVAFALVFNLLAA